MKRMFIIHGWSGSPNKNWLPWLKSELENLGYKIFVPEMPDADSSVIEEWVNKLFEVVGIPDKDTYFIGHSIGCQAILRYLENIDNQVGGAVFVAGWFNLEDMETDEEKEIAKPWIEIPINIEKVKSVLPKSVLVISDNDPYGCLEENKEKFSEIMSKIFVMPNAEHITESKHSEILDQTLLLVS